MSKVLMAFSIGFMSLLNAQITSQPFDSSIPLSHDQVQKQQYENQKAQLCAYFSQLVGNFLSIVQNPHNSAHVTGNICDILNNVVNIAISCIKRSGVELTDEEMKEVARNIDDQFAEYADVIRATIIKRVKTFDVEK